MITDSIISIVLKEKTAILSKRIVESMSEPPQAIYLVGGYGRGEGAWYEDEAGLHPYNDFDVAVITDQPLSIEKTEVLRKDLAKEVGIKWVDIDYYSLDVLSKLTPTIHNVDLLEGGCLIYGEDVIKNNNIKLPKNKIGKQDLIILYWTRMWTFLGSWEGAFHDLSIEEARFFKNQMAKGTLAACDMILVKLQLYTTSYRERANIILNYYSNDEIICDIVRWAIKEKMRPSCDEMNSAAMQDLYFKVKDLFIKSFKFAFGNKAHYFLNPDETRRYYVLHTKSYLKYFLSSLFRQSVFPKRQDVYYAMNYVFHANENGEMNRSFLDKSSDLLMKHGYIEKGICNWDELRIAVAEARNNI